MWIGRVRLDLHSRYLILVIPTRKRIILENSRIFELSWTFYNTRIKTTRLRSKLNAHLVHMYVLISINYYAVTFERLQALLLALI